MIYSTQTALEIKILDNHPSVPIIIFLRSPPGRCLLYLFSVFVAQHNKFFLFPLAEVLKISLICCQVSDLAVCLKIQGIFTCLSPKLLKQCHSGMKMLMIRFENIPLFNVCWFLIERLYVDVQGLLFTDRLNFSASLDDILSGHFFTSEHVYSASLVNKYVFTLLAAGFTCSIYHVKGFSIQFVFLVGVRNAHDPFHDACRFPLARSRKLTPHGKQNTTFEGALSLPKQPSRMNVSTEVALSVNYLNYRPNEIVFVKGGGGK